MVAWGELVGYQDSREISNERPRKGDNLPGLARNGRGTVDVLVLFVPRCWSVLRRQQTASTSLSVDDVFSPVRPPSHPPKSRGVSTAAEGGTHETPPIGRWSLSLIGANQPRRRWTPPQWPETRPAEFPPAGGAVWLSDGPWPPCRPAGITGALPPDGPGPFDGQGRFRAPPVTILSCMEVS